jgi:hypothetical protein
MSGPIRLATLLALLLVPAVTRSMQAQDRAANERNCRIAVGDSLGRTMQALTVEQASVDAGGTALVTWRRADGPYGNCRVDPGGRVIAVEIHRTTERAGAREPTPVAKPPVVAIAPGERITCASNENRRSECPVPSGSEVRLVKALSGAPCEENRTWGREPTRIWVDHGCRAEFEVRKRGEETAVGEVPGSVKQTDLRSLATCRNEVRSHYRIPMPQIATEVASRQGAGTVDIAWRTTNGARGTCRVNRNGKLVRFEIEEEGSEAVAPVPVRPEQRVTCASDDGKLKECPIGADREVRLARKLSDAACIQGRSWGADRNRHVIWVTAGCRAEFSVSSR